MFLTKFVPDKMIYYIIKIVITVLLIVAISEISKRSTLIGAILASIPLISVLAMTWLYIDTKDVQRVVMLSSSVFWLVIPSLSLFLVLPFLLKKEINFYVSMSISVIITILFYFIMIAILKKFGINL